MKQTTHLEIFITDGKNDRVSEDKGKRFLELVDEQSNLQWSIVTEIAKLAKLDWESPEIQAKLEAQIQRHEEITRDLGGLDGL